MQAKASVPTRPDQEEERELTDLECLSIRVRQVAELVRDIRHNPTLDQRLDCFVGDCNRVLFEVESQLVP